ncbi:Cut9-interacting protein scn1 [Cyphellophora attinorum]|uniref:Cut9-interacting protein scn1 n=1 Tax=Cyphellophora attinorum TaxID=1664694 RepID=A0A0N1H8J3_9EURO|nr:Cut9-interacting protein scn1 [Phialophora attinorum]KPI43270.1 Cut9-interacting protein scn1 [Phialophora attinorum]
MELNEDEKAMWDVGVFDAHCHPTDIMASVQDIAKMHARVLTVMATRREDQPLVVDSAKKYLLEDKVQYDSENYRGVVPAFGWHPWFSHQMVDDRGAQPHDQIDIISHYKSVLIPQPDGDDEFLRSIPKPLSLSHYLQATAQRLEQFPFALVGEIGLDRAFRLPKGEFLNPDEVLEKTKSTVQEHTPGSREGRPLTPYRVNLEHQKAILKAQLQLAGKYRRPVSVHSVQTHGVVFDLLSELWEGHERLSKRQRKRRQSNSNTEAKSDVMEVDDAEKPLPYPPRICMHSYSGPPEALKQYLGNTVPADVYFSFSICINFSTPAAAKAETVIRAVPAERILVESDLHCAGDRMDQLLKEIVVKICEIRGWGLEEGARQLKQNWEKFVFG